MKKILTILILGGIVGFAFARVKEIELPYTFYRVSGRAVVKFQDPDNGSTCYILAGYGISCLKI